MSDPMQYPPPGPPVGWPPVPPPRRRRAAVIGVLIAVFLAVVGLVGFGVGRFGGGRAPQATPAPVTVAAEPPAPIIPTPVPTAAADRSTCRSVEVDAAGLIQTATEARAVIPKGTSILDPAVQAHATWRAAVIESTQWYDRAGDAVAVASGTTPILGKAAGTLAQALHSMAMAFRTFDPTSGNAETAARAAGTTVDVLCERLAPE